MAGNYGKYIDRCPVICAAGKISNNPITMDTVPKTLKEYTVDDSIEALKWDARIRDSGFKEPIPKPPIDNKNFYLTNTEIRDLLNPPVKTRYQTLLGDLEETIHDSYWNKEVGKREDPTPALPRGTIPYQVTYGTPSKKEVTMKELINPPKTVYEVLYDSQVGHDLYIKTHGDYNPGEQLHRNYGPPYDGTKRFGYRSKFDYRGIYVKCCCNWHIQKPVVECNKRQAEFDEQTKFPLGKSLTPNHNIDRVPKGHTFGKPSNRPFYGVPELLKSSEYEPCVFKRDFLRWLGMLNNLRKVLSKWKSRGYINFHDFFKKILYHDKDKTGWMNKDKVYDLCLKEYIMFSMDELEPLLKLLKILDNDMINYRRFLNLIDANSEPLQLIPIKDIPDTCLYYCTTQQEAACDDLFIDNTKLPTAGVPSNRIDLPRAYKTEGLCKADMESLPDATTVKTLLNPSIYTRWGLSFRDFFLPRKAETLKKLFEKIGYVFSENTFEQIWKEGVELDGTGLCCVDTFKNLLDKYTPHQHLRVDESDCRDVFPYM